MKRVMVRYKVKRDRAADNEGYIAKVFEQLVREKPRGLRYAAFKLDDGVTFIHVAVFTDADRSKLGELSAFKAFVSGIRERCEEAPLIVELKEIDSYESP
jgi:hypothetical protein